MQRERPRNDAGMSNYLSLIIVLSITIMMLTGSTYLLWAHNMMNTLGQGAQIIDRSMVVNGCLTAEAQTDLITFLQGNHIDPERVFLKATTSKQSFGSKGLQVTIGYDYNVYSPSGKSVIWNKYFEVSVPVDQSQYIPNSGADASGCVPISGAFTGLQGGSNSGGASSGSTPVDVATSMTLNVNNLTPAVNAAVIASGTVYFGSNVAPAGTQVTIRGGGVSHTFSTNASGVFTGTLSFKSPGEVVLQAASGLATASANLSIKANGPKQIVMHLPDMVRVGDPLTIAGMVADENGNAVVDGTNVQISSSDTQDLPLTSVSTHDGNFSYQLTRGITQLEDLTITAAAGTASVTKNLSVIAGNPESISLNLSASALSAGSTMMFSGRVLGPYGTPVPDRSVTILSGTDASASLPVLTTDSMGYFSGDAVLTLAGNQTYYAQVSGPLQSLSKSVQVSAGAPAKVSGFAGTPIPVNQGANVAVSGTVSDVYGNPVVSGTNIQLASSVLAEPISSSTFSGKFNSRVTFQTPGVQMLSAKDENGNALNGGGLQVNVMPTTAYSLLPNQNLITLTAGQSTNVTFTLKDSNGQPVSGKTINFNETPQGLAAITPTAAVTNSEGMVSVSVGVLTSAGLHTLTASLTEDEAVMGTVGISVTPGAPSQAFANVSPSTTQVWTEANPVSLPLVVGTLTDSYANSISGAEVTVSGAYGANASGITDVHGYFAVAIKPTNVGGPFPITISSGTWSDTIGTLKVTPKPPALTVTSLRGSAIADVNVPYSIRATLTDSDGIPIKGVEVKLDISTDGNADYPKSISTDNSGNALFSVKFTKVSNQTLEFSSTANGKSLNSTLYLYSAVPIPGNVIYQSVTPTTVKAGNTLSVSGFVYSQFGNPMPSNTEVCLSLPGSNASDAITHTASDGSFTATLNPTKAGSFTLGCTVDSITFNYGTKIRVTAGAPTTGTLTYSSATIQCGNYNTAYVHLFDNWGNNVPDATVTLGTNATVTVTQPPKTDENGIASVPVGPFNVIGTYHFYTTSPITLSSVNFTVYDTKFVTVKGSNYTSSGTVPTTYSYNIDGYTGTLNRSSIGSVVVSGSYTPEGSITKYIVYHVNCVRIDSSAAQWAYLVNPGEMGIVFLRTPWGSEKPQTFYYNRDGFHGTLSSDTGSNSKDGYANGSSYFYAPDGDKIFTHWFYLTYSGTVYNDAVDTRVYNYYGNYSGYVTKWP